MRVLLYPEKTYAALGAISWEITWEQMRPGASKNSDDWDYDRDIQYFTARYPSHSAAACSAKKLLKDGVPFFGAVTLRRQVVDWFVKEDGVAEWTDAGPLEEIT